MKLVNIFKSEHFFKLFFLLCTNQDFKEKTLRNTENNKFKRLLYKCSLNKLALYEKGKALYTLYTLEE